MLAVHCFEVIPPRRDQSLSESRVTARFELYCEYRMQEEEVNLPNEVFA